MAQPQPVHDGLGLGQTGQERHHRHVLHRRALGTNIIKPFAVLTDNASLLRYKPRGPNVINKFKFELIITTFHWNKHSNLLKLVMWRGTSNRIALFQHSIVMLCQNLIMTGRCGRKSELVEGVMMRQPCKFLNHYLLTYWQTVQTKGCRHSSVDSSVPTILLPRVWVPSRPSALLSFIVKFVLYVKRTKITKRCRVWPIFY